MDEASDNFKHDKWLQESDKNSDVLLEQHVKVSDNKLKMQVIR